MKRRSLIEKMDILESATTLIADYGEHAAFHAARRAVARREKGDREGQETWLAVHRAITKLTQVRANTRAPAGTTIH
jgi:hypothetical protein